RDRQGFTKTQGAGFRQGILFQSHDFAQEPFFGIIDYTGLFGSPGIAADVAAQEELLANIQRLTIHVEKDIAHEQAHLDEIRMKLGVRA
ncbi:MAG: hypothetical protein KJ914_00005, partial [Gammaproteobacteria bacterium]|nr:hypothetical protein [Gammaproteobacteria bacterium]MBU1724200.1 hypothetical protein [Gammaproteobacteria bacterium]MBU2005648.1 hypothetical protein [Gammaproteobacteria bacterium]